MALIACGAIAAPCAQVVEAHGWPVDVHPLPPLLHNQPQEIAGEVRRLATALQPSYGQVVVGYADCGTYGALDEVCAELGLRRLPGLHCYDLFAGDSRLAALAITFCGCSGASGGEIKGSRCTVNMVSTNSR